MSQKNYIIFTADLHGTNVQYEKLVRFAVTLSETANVSVVIGGDICPKGVSAHQYLLMQKKSGSSGDSFIESQRDFLSTQLPILFEPLRTKCPVFIMMGNDDCRVNEHLLDTSNLYTNIHMKRTEFDDEYDIVGISYVPITPFLIKDWEKFDMSTPPDHQKELYEYQKEINCQFRGLKSGVNGWYDFTFTKKDEKEDSIQKDMQSDLFVSHPDKLIVVSHCPPFGTDLDKTTSGNMGSFAI